MSSVSKENSKVQGLVAQIINARELAINIGADHGVTEDMRFAVLAATSLEIRDPQTKELLDTIDREKVRVEVVTLRPKITICRTYQTKYVPGGPFHLDFFSGIRDMNDLSRPPQRIVETLKANESEYPAALTEAESYVKVGDRVIEIDDNSK